MKMSLAAVLGVAVSSPTLAADMQPDSRFDAFLAACLDGHRDPERRAAAVRAAGWTGVPDDADPELDSLMAKSRESLADAEKEDGMTGSVAAFTKSVEDRTLYLVTNELNMPDDAAWKIDFLGCRLYDFAATGQIDPALITTHFDEGPVELNDEPGELIGQTWNIEKIDGVWSLRNAYIPEGGKTAATTGFSGAMLQITSTRE